MSRLRLSGQVKALEQRQAELQQQLASLTHARRSLQLRYALLSLWCDSLSFVHLHLALLQPDTTLHPETGWLLQQEVSLLQQLTDNAGASEHCSQQSLHSLLRPDVDTISPCTDPMEYLHRQVSKPPAPDAATLTAEQMAEKVRTTVLTISVKLHQLEALPPWDRHGMLQQIADVWGRYMHYMASLVLLGKQDVIELAFSINLDTMTCEPAAAASHQAAQAATLVPLLDLSEQQQELIAAGTTLYYDLLQPIHLQRHRVHEELAAVEKEYDVQRDGGGECTSADGHDDGDGDAKPGAVDPGSSSSGSNSGKLERLSSRQALLHKQQELTSRLSLLLHKEYCVRLTGMGWFIGCLSYTQLSKLAVMCWPYGMRVLFLATEIMRHREHVNKQRLQLCS